MGPNPTPQSTGRFVARLASTWVSAVALVEAAQAGAKRHE
jgi:hypothetical protein